LTSDEHNIVSYTRLINSKDILGRREKKARKQFDIILGWRKKKGSFFLFGYIIGSNIFSIYIERDN